MKASFWKRHRALCWVAGIVLAVLAVLTVAVVILARRAEPFLRARIVDGLSSHFHARVELDRFSLSFGNGFRGECGVWARGRGLRIWPANNSIAPGMPDTPVISLDEFRFHAPLRYKPGEPVHISEVRLSGLEIRLPPKPHELHFNVLGPSPATQPPSAPLVTFRIDRVIATHAHLVHESNEPGKLPLDFDISYLLLKDFTPGGAMHFEAQLTNPRPEGVIHAVGTFGPWQAADPGASPVEGDYQFENANLATFKQIAGTLNSDGHYAGTLNNLDVTGETDTPDFRLPQFGSAAHLRTRFHATVDGTNGDTWLNAIDATLGQSRFTVKGKVVRAVAASGADPHTRGHDIDLNVNITNGRIEDFTRLATRESEPMLTGVLNLDSTMDIPPGSGDMHQRLKMNGEFVLDDAVFTNSDVQSRLKQLSLRGQGKPDQLKSTDPMQIPAHLEGYFQVASGVITFPTLQFKVAGANIRLKGTYGLDAGALDFSGAARMDATISQMVGGWKGLLLKPADRFFKKDGAGTSLPIHVGGVAAHPEIGLDLHH